jgi:transposase InsO family protein
VRFQAEMPNQRWQADITHWRLAAGRHVEVLNLVDDHSRLLVASHARPTTKAADVVASFHHAAAANGFPASMPSDNGAVFTAAPHGGGRCAIELELARLAITYRHSRAYHPQTCGKVERFPPNPQTLAGQAAQGRNRGRAAGPARPVRRLLQPCPASSSDALEQVGPSIPEPDPGAGHQISHGPGDQHLARLGRGRHPRPDMDRDPRQVRTNGPDFPGVQADPDLEAQAVDRIAHRAHS